MPDQLQLGKLWVEATMLPAGQGTQKIRIDGVQYEVSEVKREGSGLSFVYEGQCYRFDVSVGPQRLFIGDARANYIVERRAPGADAELREREDQLVSKMPGKVLQLLVAPGSPVEAGTPLLILEAMKMEHQVVSPADGVLNGYPVHEGQRVMPGDLLADFSPGIG